ncbi:fungal hydrophobin-domain-containing protein [Earliella scabrosa]|nr:fungal hydrophobin-domain-containing protein [Earliella scabrosa]
MIFSRALTLAALPLLAVATHGLHKARTTSSPCSTGSLLCCSSVEQPSGSPGLSPLTTNIFGLLAVAVPSADVLVGVTCTPITAVGVGGAGSCSANTVCCENNSFGGLVAIGCVPVVA